nr:shikimate dehydrogenase [Eubacterium sp.]
MDYGLIGEKLGHSLSKPIHESLADYTYDIHPLTKDEFKEFMEEKAFQAINVTIPYKKDVIPYLDSMDDNAKAIGAVNTIVNNNGKLKGYNTDFSGFDYMVERHGVELKDKKVVVLGNGGAAQAIKAVVKKHEAKEMIVVDVVDDGESITYEECFEKHTDADVIINTSPIGMYPKVDASPVDLTKFPNCQAVMDVVYNPITTKLVAQARDLGMIGVTGLEMLVAQAKYAVEIFLDVEIDDSRINEIYEEVKKDFL